MKKIPDTDKKPILLKVSLSLLQPTSVTTAIAPLQPQQKKIISEQQRLIAQVERINQMAEELEAEILELKAIANTLNTQKRYPALNHQPCKNMCQYFAVSIPWVKQKPDKSFILTTRRVDLFRAEREAALLAEQLRQQTKKRLASQRHRKNKSRAEADTKCLFKKVLMNGEWGVGSGETKPLNIGRGFNLPWKIGIFSLRPSLPDAMRRNDF